MADRTVRTAGTSLTVAGKTFMCLAWHVSALMAGKDVNVAGRDVPVAGRTTPVAVKDALLLCRFLWQANCSCV